MFAGRPKATKALKWKRTVKLSSNGVALCAMLYSIHDVTARDGHILIMTTNVINQLDNALLCPGRIDMETDFGYGSLGTIRTSFTQPPPGTSWVFWTQGNSFAQSLANLRGVNVRWYRPSIGYIRK
ncbi:hypothetical protein BDQ94DRAFT_176211 [Aspergillus welwitschiae]|uniref:ATPase AAA-type core domain-containing protein n=1 Tax=Aspergillus welwitschiae TaxID=1341132 RepID=A0A3F3PID9_9EURO|nr:hypothetical protein BDQ94DRAFT_176211 [Aspergillus welwitschiae]RDH26705.1 hypothetical protein BDQ94DRAFT_176211 [Aspergillus welwitschiae]